MAKMSKKASQELARDIREFVREGIEPKVAAAKAYAIQRRKGRKVPSPQGGKK